MESIFPSHFQMFPTLKVGKPIDLSSVLKKYVMLVVVLLL